MSLQTWQETLTSQTADGPTLTAAAAASCINTANKITLPNNFFYVGRMIKVTAQGRISCAVTTPGTGRFDIRLGGTLNTDSGAFALNVVAKTSVAWWLEYLGTCRTVGSGTAATIMWFGSWGSEALVGSGTGAAGSTGHGGVFFSNNSAGGVVGGAATAVGAGFDSTAALSVDMFFTQTVATGSLTVQSYKVESLT